MKRKQEQQYVDKHWKSMKSNLKDYLSTGNQEALHDFRLEVKKMRAFLVLQPNNKLFKDFKPVKKIFKHAGDIRNIFLNLELGQQHQVDDENFVLQQHLQLEQLIIDFKSQGDKYIKDVKNAYHHLSDRIESIPDLHINLFYERQLHQIADSLTKITFDDSLHHCRKLIKELIYNYKLFMPVLQMQLNEEYLNNIQTAIGDWHDITLATDLFKNNKTAMVGLKKSNTSVRRKITGLAKDFFDKATTTTELAIEQID